MSEGRSFDPPVNGVQVFKLGPQVFREIAAWERSSGLEIAARVVIHTPDDDLIHVWYRYRES